MNYNQQRILKQQAKQVREKCENQSVNGDNISHQTTEELEQKTAQSGRPTCMVTIVTQDHKPRDAVEKEIDKDSATDEETEKLKDLGDPLNRKREAAGKMKVKCKKRVRQETGTGKCHLTEEIRSP